MNSTEITNLENILSILSSESKKNELICDLILKKNVKVPTDLANQAIQFYEGGNSIYSAIKMAEKLGFHEKEINLRLKSEGTAINLLDSAKKAISYGFVEWGIEIYKQRGLFLDAFNVYNEHGLKIENKEEFVNQGIEAYRKRGNFIDALKLVKKMGELDLISEIVEEGVEYNTNKGYLFRAGRLYEVGGFIEEAIELYINQVDGERFFEVVELAESVGWNKEQIDELCDRKINSIKKSMIDDVRDSDWFCFGPEPHEHEISKEISKLYEKKGEFYNAAVSLDHWNGHVSDKQVELIKKTQNSEIIISFLEKRKCYNLAIDYAKENNIDDEELISRLEQFGFNHYMEKEKFDIAAGLAKDDFQKRLVRDTAYPFYEDSSKFKKAAEVAITLGDRERAQKYQVLADLLN